MRIDLPQCNLKTCRYSSDGNCIELNRYISCEYSCAKAKNDKLKAEIEQLKAELEQSMKLPCKVGDKFYYIEEDSTKDEDIRQNRFECMAHIVRFIEKGYFGKTVFLTREEAEQALKGGAE